LRVAPDGRSAAVSVSDGELVIIFASGSVHVLVRSHAWTPRVWAWSPDSRYIAAQEGARLAVVDARTGTTQLALEDAFGGTFAPALPDRLVYDRRCSWPCGAPHVGLEVITVGNRHMHPVNVGLITGFTPVWGAQGILFSRLKGGNPTRGEQLCLVRPDGTGVRVLATFPLGSLGSSQLGNAYPVEPSANGRELVINSASALWGVSIGPHGITRRELAGPASSPYGTAVSANGRSVLIGEGKELFTVPWRGGTRRPLERDATLGSWPR
jgi:hypothetical protein